jgi:hypothetical protein
MVIDVSCLRKRARLWLRTNYARAKKTGENWLSISTKDNKKMTRDYCFRYLVSSSMCVMNLCLYNSMCTRILNMFKPLPNTKLHVYTVPQTRAALWWSKCYAAAK